MPMRRATANEIDVAKSLEATAEMLEQHAFEQREPKYGCAHCLKTRLHKEGITSHLERVYALHRCLRWICIQLTVANYHN